jgi:ribosomal-protein-alanine N-acetyltransferase
MLDHSDRHTVLERLVALRLAPPRAVEVLPSEVVAGRDVLLRPLLASDRDACIDLLDRNADDLARWLHVHHTLSDGTREPSAACFDRLIELAREGDATGSSWRRLITTPANHPIGMVHILAIDRALECKGDIGWWLDARFRSAGLATQAVTLATRLALAPMQGPGSLGLGLQRVVAAITTDNVPSERVAAKAGYTLDPHSVCSICVAGAWKPHRLWHADAV